MVGPSSEGPPPDWAVAPAPDAAPAAAAGEDTGWRGDVADGVEAWLHASTPGSGSGSASGSASGSTSEADQAPPSGLAADDDGSGAEPDHEVVARKILLDQLTGQARTRKELADKLAKKNVPDGIARGLLDRFEEVGLIDDDAFARAWIASRQPGKGLARRALAQELRRKGINDEVAREALDEIDPDDEEAAARRLVRKKLRSVANLEPTKATRRLVGMLARKGYSGGLAYTVVREEMSAAQIVEEDEPVDVPRDW